MMPELCQCCGQEIANPVWDRDAAHEAEERLRDHLLRILGGPWKATADNALALRGEDTRLDIVISALVRLGARIEWDGER